MATANINPLFTSISGRIGNVVFYRRLNIQCIRVHVIPRNPDTRAQRQVRRTFADAVKSWQNLHAEEKYKFTRKSRHLDMSGYNLYVSQYIKANSAAEPNTVKNKSYFKSYTYRNMLRFPSVSNSITKADIKNPDYFNTTLPCMRL